MLAFCFDSHCYYLYWQENYKFHNCVFCVCYAVEDMSECRYSSQIYH